MINNYKNINPAEQGYVGINHELLKSIKENGAYKILDNISVLLIKGDDAGKYINSQTTNDLLKLESGQGVSNNLTDRKARIKAHFTIHKFSDKFIILCDNNQSENLKQHLDEFHFTEDFELEDITSQKEVLMVRGEGSLDFIEKLNPEIMNINNYDIYDLNYNDNQYFVIANNEFGENSLLFIYDKESSLKNEFKNIIDNLKINYLNSDIEEILRVEEGNIKYKVDYDSENILPETGFENFSVSYTKGCYLGQEVIARIKTYGTIPNALIGLIFEAEMPSYNSLIEINGKKAGIIKSGVFSPEFNKYICFAYLNKDFRKPEEYIEFDINDKKYKAQIKLLPFIKALSKEEKAKQYYETALTVFAENKEEEAVKLLKKAIKNKPDFSDAYESLGVILSRLEKFEEAIEIMTKLTEINPDEPMARTNLSVFYMKIGNKEEAEAQMAKATTIKFMNTMKENKNKKALQQKKQEELEAIKERMEMFKEVLETEDSEDLIANYGMGKSHFDLEEFNESIPYFQKAIELKKDYSMAYLYLGKSLEKINKNSEALEIYQKGIVAASQKGDLMPLKEMEQRKLVLSKN